MTKFYTSHRTSEWQSRDFIQSPEAGAAGRWGRGRTADGGGGRRRTGRTLVSDAQREGSREEVESEGKLEPTLLYSLFRSTERSGCRRLICSEPQLRVSCTTESLQPPSKAGVQQPPAVPG